MFKSIRRLLIACTAMVAICAPSAASAFVRAGSVGSPADSAVSPPIVGVVHPSAPRGFNWSDAGIGALGAVVLIAIGSGAAAVVLRRGRHSLAS